VLDAAEVREGKRSAANGGGQRKREGVEDFEPASWGARKGVLTRLRKWCERWKKGKRDTELKGRSKRRNPGSRKA
jgi:hypothetical protein